MHGWMQADRHACNDASRQACMHGCKQACMHAWMDASRQAFMHVYKQTGMYAWMQAGKQTISIFNDLVRVRYRHFYVLHSLKIVFCTKPTIIFA